MKKTFLSKKIKILVFTCLIIFIPLIIVSFADNYYSDRTTMYIGKQIELASTKTLQEVINGNILNEVNSSDLVSISYSDTSNISSVIINTKLINNILKDAYSVMDEVFNNHLKEYFVEDKMVLSVVY